MFEAYSQTESARIRLWSVVRTARLDPFKRMWRRPLAKGAVRAGTDCAEVVVARGDAAFHALDVAWRVPVPAW